MDSLKAFKPVFVCSAARYGDLPEAAGDEYCLLGRSNVGKSSFLNHVLSNRNLARVSSTPGKTSLANLYRVDETTVWVDLPGYGYARTSKGEKRRWSGLISDYCTGRGNLRGIIWLLDSRHPNLAADLDAGAWLARLGASVLPVFTKCDKLTRGQLARNLERFVAQRGVRGGVPYSIRETRARERFMDAFVPWARLCSGGTQ